MISDLQRGALAGSRTLPIPDGMGLRFIPVGRRADTATFEGTRLLGAGDVAVARAVDRGDRGHDGGCRAVRARTARPLGSGLSARRVPNESVARLLRALAIAGAPAGSADQPIAIQFAGAAPGSVATGAAFSLDGCCGRSFDCWTIRSSSGVYERRRSQVRRSARSGCWPLDDSGADSATAGRCFEPPRPAANCSFDVDAPVDGLLCGRSRQSGADRAARSGGLRRARGRAPRRGAAGRADAAAGLGDARRMAHRGRERRAMALARGARPARRGAVAPRRDRRAIEHQEVARAAA